MKQRTAALSVASNTALILLKVVAGTLTGSVAILTEALHSGIDLIASLVAFVSIRIAEEPADDLHHYGHEKAENIAAAIEGMLILVGCAAMVWNAIHRLITGGATHDLGIGIAVIGFSAGANVIVSSVIARNGRKTGSPALEGDAAHLRTDALSSIVVLVALVLVDITGAQWLDPVAALVVASVIVTTGVKLVVRAGEVLLDQALPWDETERIATVITSFAPQGVVGYHELRTRRGGSKKYVDVHLQFRSGTSLEAAHFISHQIEHEITRQLGGADVLIHLEPEGRVRHGQAFISDAGGS